jgi:calcium-translocating P-type ATPase
MKPIVWHTKTIEDTLQQLKTGKEGIDARHAKKLREKYGFNRLKPAKRKSPLMLFLNQFHDILIYILLVSAITTAMLQHWVDTSVILGVTLINAIIGFIQEGKAEKAIEAIKHMLPLKTTVIRDGRRHYIPAELLVPGDIVLLQSGDKVPADLRLIETHSLQIQEAIITGESNPVNKNTHPNQLKTNLGDRKCMAYSGTLVTYGRGMGVVAAIGENTEVGKITAMINKVTPLTTPLIKQMRIFGRWLTAVILLLGLISFLIGTFVWHYSSIDMFMAAVALAVAAIPEGLPAIITITLAIGVTRMAKRNAIIRRLPAVETMGAVNIICTDKTGTLTKNELAIQNIITAKHNYHVTGSGYNDKGTLLLNNSAFPLEEHHDLKQTITASLLCNDAELNKEKDEWQLHGNPTDGAILSLGLKAKIDLHLQQETFPKDDFIPFDSQHKLMASLHHDHESNGFIFIKGAPEYILKICNTQQLNKNAQPLDAKYWHSQITASAQNGQRLIAVAYCKTKPDHRLLCFDDLKQNFTLLGLFGLIDAPREEAKYAVMDCQNAGITVKMVTGDHALTAKAIAASVNIANSNDVMTGAEIDQLTDEQLIKVAHKINVYARTTPEHKLRLVRALQATNNIVAMTGDGVNDAPALKQADIGVAMGQKGTEATKEVAAMVLADDNFASIHHAVEEGRTVYDNLKKAIIYILPTSFGEAFTILIAVLVGLQLPITAVQILWVNMITTVTLSLPIAFEPSETNIMQRPPRKPTEPILTVFLSWRIMFVTFLMVVCAFTLFLLEHKLGANIAQARTVVVNMLVAGEAAYLINCRSLYNSTMNLKSIFGSRLILTAIATVILFQILFTYLPIMQHFFHSTPISLMQWLYIILFALSIYFLVEFEKWLVRGFKT